MFEHDFEEIVPPPSKTDINFYNTSINYSTLQPWGKSTYYPKPAANQVKKQKNIRNRLYSDHPQTIAIKKEKKQKVELYKYQVPLSTINFVPSPEQKQPQESIKMMHTMISLIEKKKEAYSTQKIRRMSEKEKDQFQYFHTRGFKSCIGHKNMLKQKQDHLNKIKSIMNKKSQENNKPISTRFTLLHHPRPYLSTLSIPYLEEKQISDTRKIKVSEYLRRPRKSCYVGVRKLLNLSGAQKLCQ